MTGRLVERFGDRLVVYPQFSQYKVKGDDRIHRVVHLTYRVGKRDMAYPKPMVDLTAKAVEVPDPDPELVPPAGTPRSR